MKVLLLTLVLLTGCATKPKCPDCLTLSKDQLVNAMSAAWVDGYTKGFDAGEDAADLARLKSL